MLITRDSGVPDRALDSVELQDGYAEPDVLYGNSGYILSIDYDSAILWSEQSVASTIANRLYEQQPNTLMENSAKIIKRLLQNKQSQTLIHI